MTDVPGDSARGERRVYGRPPVDGTDEEIEEWASAFVDAVLGPPVDEPPGVTNRLLVARTEPSHQSP
jgi:hypothetical protein